MWLRPHYVRDYRRMFRTLQAADPASVMDRAVGGDYVRIGAIQAQLLRDVGLRDGDFLVDIGCGSGRTAYALKDASIRYHGTDVVPELLEYARHKAGRADWRFTVVEGLTVPEETGAADVIAMFSVVTHLTASEGEKYVADAVRVLKPGGVLIVSFLDPKIQFHRETAGVSRLFQFKERLRGRSVMNVTSSAEAISKWAKRLGVKATFFGPERIGQSYVLFAK